MLVLIYCEKIKLVLICALFSHELLDCTDFSTVYYITVNKIVMFLPLQMINEHSNSQLMHINQFKVPP